MDRLDAAHALLGVSPNTVSDLDIDTRSDFMVTKPVSRSPSSDSSCGLDALAAFATQSIEAEGHAVLVTSGNSVSSTSVSSDDDSEAMPPPPPRYGRQRSCSNPEGMEKWDSYKSRHDERCRFVLPTSILEEELADAKCAVERKAEADRLLLEQKRTTSFIDRSPEEESQDSGKTEVGPDELLRRARSRLLEDLSEGTITGPAGQLTLPHSLSKYKHVYNRNGRIGIYTPAERAAIISRYHTKRSRRVWNKKIRYNCRKNLADRRLRVKGRFVKREQIPALAHMKPMDSASMVPSSLSTTPLLGDPAADTDMPDVNDPDAGFSPTEDQPFRRLRRHTIT